MLLILINASNSSSPAHKGEELMFPWIWICGFKDSDKIKAINHPILRAERTYAEPFHEQLHQNTK